MRILALIPARGGSKGIPGKNIRPLANKPLIYYTIEAARDVFDDKDICVSTDSPEIASVVSKTGLEVPFLRPKEFATDTSATYDVLLHAIKYYQEKGELYDTVVLLQPTSPFRTGKNIKEAIDIYTPDLDMIVSVVETSANPYFVLFEEDENGLLKKSKDGHYKYRQECPKVWQYNGAIYVINVQSLLKESHFLFKYVRKYVMTEEESIDIDTNLDFSFAEFLMNNKNRTYEVQQTT